MSDAVTRIEEYLGYPNLRWWKRRVGRVHSINLIKQTYEYHTIYQGYRVRVFRPDLDPVTVWRWTTNKDGKTTCSIPFKTASEARVDVRDHFFRKGI